MVYIYEIIKHHLRCESQVFASNFVCAEKKKRGSLKLIHLTLLDFKSAYVKNEHHKGDYVYRYRCHSDSAVSE